MKTPKFSALGQLLTPTAVRRRRRKRGRLVAGDGGASSTPRLTAEEAIELARGAFKDYPGPSSDEARRLFREEERRAEERKFGPNPD